MNLCLVCGASLYGTGMRCPNGCNSVTITKASGSSLLPLSKVFTIPDSESPGPIASRIADSYAALIERAEKAEAEVERLTKEVAAKDKALKVVQHAAKNLDSTGRVIAAHERKEAAKLLAMSNLEHLESERAANAILTEENERLKGELESAQ